MVRKIINGMIYTGEGKEPFLGGVEIKDGKILRVFKGPSRDEGADVIDAQGRVVTPGFVDIHRHHDMAALYDPEFGKIELAQGITTAIGGNCGLGGFPNDPQWIKEQMDYIEPVMGRAPLDTPIHSFPEYLDALDAKDLPLNVGMLVGAGAVTMAVKGFDPRPYTAEERQKAAALVAEAMQKGAVGLSFGIMYVPEAYLSFDDRVALAAECGKYGGTVCTHIRGEGDSLVASVEEVIAICKEANVPLNISHFKVTGVRNWGKGINEAIKKIEEARAAGQKVTCDAYPYNGGATTAMSLIPPSVIEGKPISFLGTEEGGKKLEEEIYKLQPNWDNMVESIGWERVVIGSVTLEKNRIYSGRNVEEIAKEMGESDPSAWFGRFVAEEEGKIGIIIMSMSQDDVDQVLQLPYAAIISDSLYGGGDNPHPRLYGSFPRILREYVKERKVMSLEEAIRKMTGAPAERMGLKGKGLLKEGYDADINIFELEKVQDKATFVNSRQLATGIDMTIIGGEIAAENSIMKEERRFGALVRKESSK